MKKSDKIILLIYLFVGISFVSGIILSSNSFTIPEYSTLGREPIKDIDFTKQIDLEYKKAYDVMTDVVNYPKILPTNILHVNIINQTKNSIFAEEEISELGIRSTFLVKHNFIPYETHTIEIMSGDAKGTILTQLFLENGTSTIIKNNIKLNLKGILYPLGLIPKNNLEHAMDSAITSFVNYAKFSENKYYKTIDDIYQELLFRSVDKQGLEYFGSLLEMGEIDEEDIRHELINSNEYQLLLKPSELKTVNELKQNTKETIDDTYQELLFRSVDQQGLEYFGSLLEAGKITQRDIKIQILNSTEGKSILLNDPNREIIGDIYRDLFDEPYMPYSEQEYYQIMLKIGEMTLDDVRENLSKK